MKRIYSLFVIVLLIVCLVGCNGNGTVQEKDGRLSVVVTSFVHYDFVRQIAGDNVNIKMLISPASEAHTYEPTPNDMLTIAGCDVFVYTGAESDVWVENVLSGIENEKMSVVSFYDIYNENFEDEHIHHDHGHSLDEHFWTNPYFSAVACEYIKDVLCEKDDKNKEEYVNNFDVLKNEILAIADELNEIKNTRVRNSVVVADRFPFYHLSRFLGDEIEFYSPYSGCSGVTEPSAVSVANLTRIVNEENIPYIFTIEFSNGKIAKSISQDVPTLTLHSCHTVSAEEFNMGITYTELMKNNLENLKKALCE